ncbi:MAG TPA: hypothetical protein VIS30_05665 [Candidatus Deferrimicrobiaceae bacterium]
MPPLADGSSIGVVGAGPAGTLFALHLLALLRERRRSLGITLIDRKTFECAGPSGCNMCAGAIGAVMVEKLERLGLPIDDRVIRRIADGYEIHGMHISVNVVNPERGAIYTVFRGGGPVASTGTRKSFDQYLLDAAVERGAEFFHERVERIERIPRGFRLGFSDGSARRFDFLVGAFGVNSEIAGKLDIPYVPPRTWHTVQAEIPADNETIVRQLRNRIHILPATGRRIRFLAITPKDDFLTLTGIGEHVRIRDLKREIDENRALATLLPEGRRILCQCHPQVPVGVGKHPYADRVGIIGDAFVSRYLKNGIESAHDTSRVLAEAILEHGVSEPELREHFYRPCIRRFRYDNEWGKVLFGIYEIVLRKSRISDAYLKGAGADEGGTRGTQARILWSVFAGDTPYREIAREAFTPRAVWDLLKNLLVR